MKALGFKLDNNQSSSRGWYGIYTYVPTPKLAKTFKGSVEYHSDGEQSPTKYQAIVDLGNNKLKTSKWERTPEKVLDKIKNLI